MHILVKATDTVCLSHFPSALIFSVLCQSSNYSYTPMNIIMYEAQAWDLTEGHSCSTHQKNTDISDSTCLNCDTVYTNISGEH